ncbi:3-deoxy-manno-octulosonate cytidylyltransferase [bacterium]|nr:3-deoxy-manno-octulosonate cytidylyltransferase [bacterium]
MNEGTKNRITAVGIIPARFDSSRLPGKPLVDIGGKPMIQWVVERAHRAQLLSRVLVATDDQNIFSRVQAIGAEVIMTPSRIASGTDRVAHVAKDLEADILVNIQVDEPFIEPKEIDLVTSILMEDDQAVMGTLMKRIKNVEELTSPNTAKVVVDKQSYALYFSRSPIPFSRDKKGHEAWIQDQIYYKHVGIYSYRKDFLLQYSQWESTALENVEKLEQLRALENGYRIKVAETEFDTICVDTPEDLIKVRQLVDAGLIRDQ